MNDNIINSNDIYIQDVVCTVIRQYGTEDDFALYNRIAEIVDVASLESVEKILNLIKLNRTALSS